MAQTAKVQSGIAKLRPEFTVYVVDSDVSTARALVEVLQGIGYVQAKFFPTLESAQTISQEDPPHILVLESKNFSPAETEAFLNKVSDLSPETLIVLMVPAVHSLNAMQFVSRGTIYDWVISPPISALEVVQKVDRAAGRLYFQFESEQIRDYYSNRASVPMTAAGSETDPSSASIGKDLAAGAISSLSSFVEKQLATKDIEKSIQLFLESMSAAAGEVPAVFFKYVPSHMSLLFSQASWLPVEKFRGVGVDLKKEDPTQLPRLLENPIEMSALNSLMREIFKMEKFAAFPLKVENEVQGVFAILADVNPNSTELIALRRVFDLAYRRNQTLKEKHLLDTNDPATGLFHRKHFLKLLDDEIARSRRILLPVSAIVVKVDGFQKVLEKIGVQQGDSVLRAIGAVLKITARTNDILARTGADEFTLLLPHTLGTGGAVKAERLRRIITATKIPLLESLGLGNVTVSCGVSEYPSYCGDAESLLKTADEALQQVVSSGGNRVCLASAPPGFKLDFAPHEASNGPKLTKGDAT